MDLRNSTGLSVDLRILAEILHGDRPFCVTLTNKTNARFDTSSSYNYDVGVNNYDVGVKRWLKKMIIRLVLAAIILRSQTSMI